VNGDSEESPFEGPEEQRPLLPHATTSLGELGNDFADGLCRALAVTAVLLCVLAVAVGVCTLLFRGAMHMKGNWTAYNAGLVRLMRRLDDFIDGLAKELHMERNLDERVKAVYNSILTQAKDGLWALVNSIVSGLSEGFSSVFVIFLYILFWLLQPLPTGGKVGALVRTYIYMKTLVSFLYGLCVTLLFVELGVDLAVLFGVISFFLNFVPEVGAFVSMLVPVPVIVLDGRIERPFVVLATALTGQLLLKFLFGNILEVKLVERDREMSIHPVWVILGLSYFGFVWGPTGMLMSVPILALMKTAAMSIRLWQETSLQKERWAAAGHLAEDFLACFEGRKKAERDGFVGSKSGLQA
jgi:predicted PurR-regulated permease PerM